MTIRGHSNIYIQSDTGSLTSFFHCWNVSMLYAFVLHKRHVKTCFHPSVPKQPEVLPKRPQTWLLSNHKYAGSEPGTVTNQTWHQHHRLIDWSTSNMKVDFPWIRSVVYILSRPSSLNVSEVQLYKVCVGHLVFCSHIRYHNSKSTTATWKI